MEPTDLVAVTLDAVRISPVSGAHRIAVLRSQEDGLIQPIFIGVYEAQAIELARQGMQMPRPMTHDLTTHMLRILGAHVERVVVTRVANSTFYAAITLAHGEQRHLIDARPSDALALGARSGAPIFVARAVLEQAGGPDVPEFWEQLFAQAGQYDQVVTPTPVQPPPEGQA